MGLFRKGSLFRRFSTKRQSGEITDDSTSSRPRSYTTSNVPPPSRSSRINTAHAKQAPTATVLPRSVSMTALPTLTPEALKPRISRLQSLEATMASIEVSLSSEQQPRRKGSQSSRSSPSNKPDMPAAQRKLHDINVANDKITKLIQEIEMLRHGIQEKDLLISDLQIQNQSLHTKQLHNGYEELTKLKSVVPPVSKMTEVQQKRERFSQIEREIENKQTVIKNLQLSMDKSEDTDLDARIRQAELEFQLEREELSILNLQQEQITVKTFLEEKANENLIQNSMEGISFYSMLVTNRCMFLVAVEVPYNPQSPNFVISAHPSGQGLFVQWARDNSTLQKGDRLLEVNGHVILGGSREDLVKILSNATTTEPLRMTILRSNNPQNPTPRRVNTREMENLKEEISSVVKKLDVKIRENKELLTNTDKLKKERDKLKKENLKLSHRISFLEDQVAELQQSWEDLRVTLHQVDLDPGKADMGNGTSSHHDTHDSFLSSSKVNGNNGPCGRDFDWSPMSTIGSHHKKALKGTTSIVVNHNPTATPSGGISNHGNAISVVRTNSSGSSVSIGSCSTSSANSERRSGLYPLRALPNKCVLSGNHNTNGRESNHSSSPNNSVNTTQIKNSMNVALNNAASKSQSFTAHKTTKSSSLSSVPSLFSQSMFNNSSTDAPNVGVIHQRVSSVNLIGPSIVKSRSINQLDNVADPNTEYSHHILQVHVPFSESGRVNHDKAPRTYYTNGYNSGFTPLTRSASANCPMTYYNSSASNGLTSGNRDVAYYSPKSGFRLHTPPQPPPRRPELPTKTEPDKSLAIHLKMNKTKIALDDFESDNEEWC